MFSSSALFLAATCLVMAVGLSESSSPITTTKVTTCDGDDNVQRLSCVEGVISVQTVLYGRMDKETCSEDYTQYLSNIDCVQSGTIVVFQNECNGKKSCEVNTKLIRIPDPCDLTYKYLETTYACVPPPIVSVTCENSIAHLRCDDGQVIQVLAADYGRHDNTTCSLGRRSSQLRNVQCTSPATKSKVENMCNGRSSCSVKARNSLFRNRCDATYKYLQVEYYCKHASV